MGALLGVCVTLASAACADGLTGVDPASLGAGPVQSASKAGSGGTVDVVCSTSYATPGGPYAYGYGRLTVKLSAASRAADGSTRQYRYRGYAEGQRVVLAANCTIPDTERAFRQMNQRFGVKEAHAGRGWNEGGGATLMSDYTLPPLTVNACRYGGDYPECNPPPPTSGTETDNPPCWNDYGCDSGSGGSPTGGDDPEPPTEEEPCQTKDVILDSPSLAPAFKQLWEASNYSPTTPQSQRLEQYAWIVKTADGYRLESMGIPPAPCGASGSFTVTPPPGTVAFVHTHPWTLFETQTSCGTDTSTYMGLPSVADLETSRTLGNLPGYILDANGMTKFSASSGMRTEARYGRCAH